MIARTIKFAFWTGLVVLVLAFLLFATQMGDCPEKVIDSSIDNSCTVQKELWGWGLLTVGAIAWVIGGIRIFRGRDSL